MSDIITIVKVHNLRSIEVRNLRLAGNFKIEISHGTFFGNFTKVIKKKTSTSFPGLGKRPWERG